MQTRKAQPRPLKRENQRQMWTGSALKPQTGGPGPLAVLTWVWLGKADSPCQGLILLDISDLTTEVLGLIIHSIQAKLGSQHKKQGPTIQG